MTADITIDDLGPEKIIHINKPRTGLEAIVIIDNIAAGPSIGGVRMTSDITLDECARLARAMTLKNAAAGLPHGGGKVMIAGDPAMPEQEKNRLVRTFARSIADVSDYIPGPDMGTNETCMAWILDETSRAVGLPRVLGGIPLDEIGATGYGLAVAIETAEAHSGVKIDGARVAVQGFGAVRLHAARFLSQMGARIVAASDSAGSVSHSNGLNFDKLAAVKKKGLNLRDLEMDGVVTGSPESVVTANCDILIPAARPDVITADNAHSIKARLVAEGANIPASPEAEHFLHERGICVLPDFIANAGGVICASVEYHGGSESQAMTMIREKIARNISQVLEHSTARNVTPRIAAEQIARKRVVEAMMLRRFG